MSVSVQCASIRQSRSGGRAYGDRQMVGVGHYQAQIQDLSQGGRDLLGTKLFSGIRNKIQEKRYKTHIV